MVLNSLIYVAGSPLARPLCRLGPLPLSLVGLFIKPGNNLVTCTDSLELCWRVLHLRKSEKRNFVYQQTRKKGTLILSSYSNYIRMLVTWPLFCSRASCGCLRASPGLFSRDWTGFFSPHGFPRFLGFDSKMVQRSVLCRSRRDLSNAYFLAKFAFDAAENEPFKVR